MPQSRWSPDLQSESPELFAPLKDQGVRIPDRLSPERWNCLWPEYPSPKAPSLLNYEEFVSSSRTDTRWSKERFATTSSGQSEANASRFGIGVFSSRVVAAAGSIGCRSWQSRALSLGMSRGLCDHGVIGKGNGQSDRDAASAVIKWGSPLPNPRHLAFARSWPARRRPPYPAERVSSPRQGGWGPVPASLQARHSRPQSGVHSL